MSDVCKRILFALQMLDSRLQKIAGIEWSDPKVMPEIAEAEVVADSLLSYLGILADDIALLLMSSVGYIELDGRPIGGIDTFGRLVNKSRSNPKLAAINGLVDSAAQTWWKPLFEWKVGARQLLLHNQHLVNLQASGSLGKRREVRGVMQSIHASKASACVDYVKMVRQFFTDLCEWLDAAEQTLVAHLQTRQSGWNYPGRTRGVLLPQSQGLRRLRFSKEYFLIPVCEDSRTLPWIFRRPIQAS